MSNCPYFVKEEREAINPQIYLDLEYELNNLYPMEMDGVKETVLLCNVDIKSSKKELCKYNHNYRKCPKYQKEVTFEMLQELGFDRYDVVPHIFLQK